MRNRRKMRKYFVWLNAENVFNNLSKSVGEVRLIKTDDYCSTVQQNK